MYQGTRYYIQRPTGYMKEGEPEWVDMEFEPGKIWRSGRFTSAADQVNDWRDAGDQRPLRIVKRTFREDVCGTYDPGQLAKLWNADADLEINDESLKFEAPEDEI